MKAFLSNLLGRLPAWLHKLLSEDNGNPSSMRLVMVAWHVTVGAVWAFLCVHSGMMVPLDASIVQTLGMTLAAKFGQKFTEAKAPAPASLTPAGVGDATP